MCIRCFSSERNNALYLILLYHICEHLSIPFAKLFAEHFVFFLRARSFFPVFAFTKHYFVKFYI